MRRQIRELERATSARMLSGDVLNAVRRMSLSPEIVKQGDRNAHLLRSGGLANSIRCEVEIYREVSGKWSALGVLYRYTLAKEGCASPEEAASLFCDAVFDCLLAQHLADLHTERIAAQRCK